MAAGAGFLLAWHDSVRYWTSVIFQTSPPGNPDYAANQSIAAVIARAGLNPHASTGLAIWLVAVVAVLLFAVLGMRPALALAGTVIFAVAPRWLLPRGGDRELHWASWEQIAGSSYVILTAIARIASALRRASRQPAWIVADDSLAGARYAIYRGSD